MDLFHLFNTWRTLAIYLTILIFLEIAHFTSYVWLNRLLIVILMFLNGLGIYIGRFLRLHTVYLLNAPLKIVKEVLIIDVKALLFVVLMVLIQATVILFIKVDYTNDN